MANFNFSYSETKVKENILLIKINGSLPGYDEDLTFWRELEAYQKQGIQYLLLDLQNLTFMSEFAYTYLLEATERFRNAKGDLKIYRIPSQVTLFDALNFGEAVSIYKSELEALDSIRQDDDKHQRCG